MRHRVTSSACEERRDARCRGSDAHHDCDGRATAGHGQRSTVFLFQPSRIHAGDTVVVRTGGTPESFTLSDRARPFQGPIGLYLVPNKIADEVRSRDDPRLVPIGALVSDKNGRGLLSFRVPDLKPGRYAAAAYCPVCARFSRGRTFLSWKVDQQDVQPRYRRLVVLNVMPSGSSSSTWLIAGGLAALALAFAAGTVVLRRRNTTSSTVSQ
jgi:hypothetical protein